MLLFFKEKRLRFIQARDTYPLHLFFCLKKVPFKFFVSFLLTSKGYYVSLLLQKKTRSRRLVSFPTTYGFLYPSLVFFKRNNGYRKSFFYTELSLLKEIREGYKRDTTIAHYRTWTDNRKGTDFKSVVFTYFTKRAK